MPVDKKGESGKVVRKVQGLRTRVPSHGNAGTHCPSCGAGMAPQEGGGTTPPLVPCSPSTHTGSIRRSHQGRRSLDGRSGTSRGVIPEEGSERRRLEQL
jgi:hypothetical protein